ncbi:hypothetical protein Taro_039688, partial [Colocasia esculenta]|nr:hypothetical protein [Colocasia esculenta]
LLCEAPPPPSPAARLPANSTEEELHNRTSGDRYHTLLSQFLLLSNNSPCLGAFTFGTLILLCSSLVLCIVCLLFTDLHSFSCLAVVLAVSEGQMDANDFSYEDEMDAEIVGVLSTCVRVLEILVDNSDNSGEFNESIPRIPSSTRNEIRRKYVQSVIGVDDATSIKMIRMNRRTFYQLYAVVRRRNLLHDTIHVSVQEQLIMFLHTIAHNVRNGVMCVNYLGSGETVSRYFKHVLKALRQLHNDYIQPPDTAIPDEIRSRDIYWPWFKDCVGAIDGTHILASIPSDISILRSCGEDQATGSFSRTVADSVVDVDSTSVDVVNEETSETPPPPRSVEDHSTSSEQARSFLARDDALRQMWLEDFFGLGSS